MPRRRRRRAVKLLAVLIVGVVLLIANGNITFDYSFLSESSAPSSDKPRSPTVREVFAVIDAGQNEFAVLGSFTLGAGSTCCTADPLADSVTLQLGGFSTTIPGGSYNLNRHGTYLFQGAVPQAGGGTVMVWAAIRPEAGGKFGYAVGVRGANNLPSANPVTVILVVGSNAGSATANAYFLDNEE